MKLQVETKKEASPHGKWYQDACGTAFAMELVGERWSLLIVRELMLGALRFSDIRASLPGISAKVLTERLASLEEARVLEKRQLPPPGKMQVYELTEWGYAAEPLIQEAGRWAAQSSAHDPSLPLSAVSLMISMRTMVNKAQVGTVRGTIGFAIGEEGFVAQPADGTLPIARADPSGADTLFRAPNASILAGGLYAGIPWAELERNAGLIIEGDRALALRYADLFALPPKLA
ncbi:winged helix-turn-helix transcriptional regulator [Pelagerythrobacter marensis]|uniref:Putative HxlR family transcriptional regulator n=1 Tax=Pelagerythrobacter marensis TaxID=543877 RepID=A0A0G3X9Z3_9SPHN|nr:helix-turn-helix domain-containing protein [Pelagerythrobacter marensis]AKM07168.1 Putative HxlR family transcriptional regulator [Pelagerythrobacter marensis]